MGLGIQGVGGAGFLAPLPELPPGHPSRLTGMEERVRDLTSVGFRPFIRKYFSSVALGFTGLLVWFRTPSHRLRGRPTNLGAEGDKACQSRWGNGGHWGQAAVWEPAVGSLAVAMGTT